MNCPSCKKYYSERTNIPLNLPCGHTFCKPCLTGILNSGRIKCQICSGTFSSSLEKLSKNFIALSIGCDKKVSNNFNECQLHPGEHLMFNCVNCTELICPMCVPLHKGHKFIEQKYSSILKS